MKIARLDIVVVHPKISTRTTTSNLTLPEEAMRQKISRLRLKVVVRQIQQTTTSSKREVEAMRSACRWRGCVGNEEGSISVQGPLYLLPQNRMMN